MAQLPVRRVQIIPPTARCTKRRGGEFCEHCDAVIVNWWQRYVGNRLQRVGYNCLMCGYGDERWFE